MLWSVDWISSNTPDCSTLIKFDCGANKLFGNANIKSVATFINNKPMRGSFGEKKESSLDNLDKLLAWLQPDL